MTIKYVCDRKFRNDRVYQTMYQNKTAFFRRLSEEEKKLRPEIKAHVEKISKEFGETLSIFWEAIDNLYERLEDMESRVESLEKKSR